LRNGPKASGTARAAGSVAMMAFRPAAVNSDGGRSGKPDAGPANIRAGPASFQTGVGCGDAVLPPGRRRSGPPWARARAGAGTGAGTPGTRAWAPAGRRRGRSGSPGAGAGTPAGRRRRRRRPPPRPVHVGRRRGRRPPPRAVHVGRRRGIAGSPIRRRRRRRPPGAGGVDRAHADVQGKVDGHETSAHVGPKGHTGHGADARKSSHGGPPCLGPGRSADACAQAVLLSLLVTILSAKTTVAAGSRRTARFTNPAPGPKTVTGRGA
jgi:hypothetical protein